MIHRSWEFRAWKTLPTQSKPGKADWQDGLDLRLSRRDAMKLARDLLSALDDFDGSRYDALTGERSNTRRIEVASLFAIGITRKTSDGRLLLFNTGLAEVAVSRRDSVLTQAARIQANGGTATALPMLALCETRYKADNIVLITDEQQNTGTPFVDALDRYRREVNRQARAFIIDVAPYQGSLTPSDPLTWYLYGWSDQALSFIALASQGWGSIADVIRAGGESTTTSEA